MALSYASVVAGFGVLMLAALQAHDLLLVPLIVGAACLAILVLARQILAVRENMSLLRERTILASEARFKALIQHASDIVTIIDANWTISFVSPSATRTLGYSASELVGVSFLGLVHTEETVDAARRLRESLLDPAAGDDGALAATAARRHAHRDRHDLHEPDVRREHPRARADDPRRVGALLARGAAAASGVPRPADRPRQSRAVPGPRASTRCRAAAASCETLGVVFVDLDNFKTVNDSLGHSVGDLLLRSASRAAGVVPARLRHGGAPGRRRVRRADRRHASDATTSPQVADRITKALLDPFVARRPGGARDGQRRRSRSRSPNQTAEELLRNADLAMYLAKSRGTGQAALFEPSMHAAAVDRLELQKRPAPRARAATS